MTIGKKWIWYFVVSHLSPVVEIDRLAEDGVGDGSHLEAVAIELLPVVETHVQHGRDVHGSRLGVDLQRHGMVGERSPEEIGGVAGGGGRGQGAFGGVVRGGWDGHEQFGRRMAALMAIRFALLQRSEELLRTGRGKDGVGADGGGGLLHFAGEADAPLLAERDDDLETPACEATVDRHFSQGSDALGQAVGC